MSANVQAASSLVGIPGTRERGGYLSVGLERGALLSLGDAPMHVRCGSNPCLTP
jgi:hypothetical protein